MVNKMFTLMDLTKGILQKQKQGHSPKAEDSPTTKSIPSPGAISKKSIAED